MEDTDDLTKYILVQRDAISKETIDKILEYTISAEKEDLRVFDPDKSDNKVNSWIVNRQFRDTQAVIEFNNEINALLMEVYRSIVIDLINPYYGFEIDGCEKPQILCYKPGGHYKPHVDAEALWEMSDGSISWRKHMDRDLSTLIYLNNGFTGGDLVFPDLGVRIIPEPGLLVTFPSTHHFEHGVEPVISGNRYTIVNWMTVKGFDRIEDKERLESEEKQLR